MTGINRIDSPSGRGLASYGEQNRTMFLLDFKSRVSTVTFDAEFYTMFYRYCNNAVHDRIEINRIEINGISISEVDSYP